MNCGSNLGKTAGWRGEFTSAIVLACIMILCLRRADQLAESAAREVRTLFEMPDGAAMKIVKRAQRDRKATKVTGDYDDRRYQN